MMISTTDILYKLADLCTKYEKHTMVFKQEKKTEKKRCFKKLANTAVTPVNDEFQP